jgi:hypothetical protein
VPTDLTCPHCQKNASHPVVPQATFDERIKSLGEQRDGFKAEALKHQADLAKLTTDAAAWRAAADKLSALEQRSAEDAALTAAGLRTDLADHHRRFLRDIYGDAPKPEQGEKPDFGAWLKTQAGAENADPLILALRAPAASSSAATGAVGGKPAPRPPWTPPQPPPNPPPTHTTRADQLRALTVARPEMTAAEAFAALAPATQAAPAKIA